MQNDDDADRHSGEPENEIATHDSSPLISKFQAFTSDLRKRTNLAGML